MAEGEGGGRVRLMEREKMEDKGKGGEREGWREKKRPKREWERDQEGLILLVVSIRSTKL